MKEVSGLNKIYLISNWIMRFSTINLIWFTINVPIFLLMFIFRIIKLTNPLLLFIFLLLIPILFFPSTTAMFAVIRDWIIDYGESSIINTYYLKFKQNFKNSFKCGLLLTTIWIIGGIDLYYFVKNDYTTLIIATFFLLIFFFIININFFLVASHYYLNVKNTFRTVLVVTVGKPLMSIFILVINGAIIFISLNNIVLIPFFSGVSLSYFSFFLFYRTIGFIGR